MNHNLSKLSFEELSQLIEDAGKERADRKEQAQADVSEPPAGGVYATNEPTYRIDVRNGLLILRMRSHFYGWVSYTFPKAAAAEFLALFLRFTISGDIENSATATAAPTVAPGRSGPVRQH
jgi:hypothetical protein